MPDAKQARLVPRLQTFLQQAPMLDVHVSTTERLVDLQAEGVQFAVRHGRGPYTGLRSERLLDDDLIRAMIERDVVIGAVPFNNFLQADWAQSGGRQTISLSMLADQMDYICQIAGDANHVGIGTDFDGGFGLQSSPKELDSIADLPLILPLLRARGYSDLEIESIAHGNFLRVLQSALPQ